MVHVWGTKENLESFCLTLRSYDSFCGVSSINFRFLNFVTGESYNFQARFQHEVSRPPFEVVMLLFQSTRTKANAQASLT